MATAEASLENTLVFVRVNGARNVLVSSIKLESYKLIIFAASLGRISGDCKIERLNERVAIAAIGG